MTKDQLEQEALGWLAEVGWQHRHGPDLAPDGTSPERDSHRQVLLVEVVDIFDAVGLDKPNIGILDDAFLAEVRNLPERNLAVELLERLLEGEIKSRFAGNVVQNKKFSTMLADMVQRYQNRSID